MTDDPLAELLRSMPRHAMDGDNADPLDIADAADWLRAHRNELLAALGLEPSPVGWRTPCERCNGEGGLDPTDWTPGGPIRCPDCHDYGCQQP